jgi:hypothetical protein
MPSLKILLSYCLLHIFTYVEANNAREFVREGNPNALRFALIGGAGLLAACGFPLYYAIAVGPWYWGLILALVGYLPARIAFDLLQTWGNGKIRLAFILGGFLAIPACIVALLSLCILDRASCSMSTGNAQTKWFGWLVVLGVPAVYLLRSLGVSLLPLSKELAAARNVLLAEHYLAAHDVTAQSPFSKELADMVRDVTRASGFPNATDEFIAGTFNRDDRFRQLNMIALALYHADVEPPLPGEFWQPPRNPYVAKRHPGSIEAISALLHRDHGVKIDIGETPLRFVDGHILNS